MQRVQNQRQAEAIAFALSYLPRRVRGLVGHAEFLVGVDPIFVGLHRHGRAVDGRSYRDTGHVAYPCHQPTLPTARRATTIVLPTDRDLNAWTIIHELGHVLDERTRFEHMAAPVTDYARTNRGEAFAEAFTVWATDGWTVGYGDQPDDATMAFFGSLAA